MFKVFTYLSTFIIFCYGKTDYMARLIEGKEADQKDWNFMVSIFHRYIPNKFVPICGGVILTEQYILTAAHCLFKKEPENFVIGADGTKIPSFLELKGEKVPISNWGIAYRYVESLTIHPQYNDVKVLNDIGILKVSEPLQFLLQNVRTISLETALKAPKGKVILKSFQNIINIILTAGDICRVAGLGKVVEENKGKGKITLQKEDILKESDVSILSLEECKDFYTPDIIEKLIMIFKGEKKMKVRDHNICANTTGTSEFCVVRSLFTQYS